MAAVVARDFGGCVISKQNLCEWRAGGSVEWQARQETLAQARELTADAAQLSAATKGKLTDHLATVLAAHDASALAGWDGELSETLRRQLRALRGLCQDIVELRRGDHGGGGDCARFLACRQNRHRTKTPARPGQTQS